MNRLHWISLKARFSLARRFRVDRFPSHYLSHSQFGEDMVLRAIFGDRPSGRYVDVGAHHPVYYSNTHYFYRRGWRGVNIDAAPGTQELFDVLRPADINVQACIAGEAAAVPRTFFVVDPPACSTLDEAGARELVAKGVGRIVAEIPVRTMTLAQCLEQHLPPGPLDLLNIDVEGLDDAILRGNDWDRWRPEVVVFECHGVGDVRDLDQNPTVRYLAQMNYRVAAMAGPSIIMRRRAEASERA